MPAAWISEQFRQPVTAIRGIGPQRKVQFARLGVQTIGDLVLLLPREYKRFKFVPIKDLREGEIVAVSGMVKSISSHPMRRGGLIVNARLADATGSIRVTWFNQGYVLDKLREGQWLLVEGKVKSDKMGCYVGPASFEEVDEEEGGFLLGRAGKDVIRVVYPLSEGLTQRVVANAIAQAMSVVMPRLTDPLPEELRKTLSLPALAEAFQYVHAPEKIEDAERGRKRLVFDELFLFSLAVLIRKKGHERLGNRRRIVATEKISDRIKRRIPFELTKAQRRVISEIERDLAGPHYMNRLLQGDVGTGKTIVAFHAMLLAVAAGHQAAVLAPTEILAQQHYSVLSRLLEGSKVRVELLTSSVRGDKRSDILKETASGQVGILIGTHAIIEKGVRFKSLALVIMDEQHRFGVMQRQRLREKGGDDVHTLLMTATPIPRTLALTLYGDLDVSLLDEYPPGRGETLTRLVPPGKEPEMWDFARKKAQKGERVYVVVPIIEESETLDIAAAKTLHKQLSVGQFKGIPVGLMHGRLNSAEKAAVMKRFRSGALPVIVSTVVVEVGVDVPEATVMVVMNAERYGLSQLHQLRGRIGRGAKRSFFFMVPGSREGEVLNRLAVLEGTRDGFKVAEEDFRLRGPGEFFGAKQHGEGEFLVADLLRDYDVLISAREEARKVLESDPHLSVPGHENLKHRLIEVFGERMHLVDVG